jgi:hypothetical protein
MGRSIEFDRAIQCESENDSELGFGESESDRCVVRVRQRLNPFKQK